MVLNNERDSYPNFQRLSSPTFTQPDFSCIVSGQRHQGHESFLGGGTQCVAMAYCASVFSSLKGREDFSTADVELILEAGDALYMLLAPNLPLGELYLNPDEIPNQFVVGDKWVHIENIWCHNGLFATENNPLSIETTRQQLLEVLSSFFISHHDDINTSFIFTGQNYTVSFWRHNNFYFLFNSHSVDILNHPTDEGLARLFLCSNLSSLVKLLFARNKHDGQEYSIHRLRVINFVNIQGSVDSHEMLLEESCTSPIISNYVAPITESNIYLTTSVDSLDIHNVEFQAQSDSLLSFENNTFTKIKDRKEIGSPIMKTRGRKQTKTNAVLVLHNGRSSYPNSPRLSSPTFTQPDFSCIISGRRHQGHLGGGTQCVAMAYCASVFSSIKGREDFSTDDVELILKAGDALYMRLAPNLPLGELYLNPDEIPNQFVVGDKWVHIENIWCHNGLFATENNPLSIETTRQQLLEVLSSFFISDHDDINTSFIFTGQNYTVSFWRHNNFYFLFNSHSVDILNHPTDEGLARLFLCSNLSSLVKLLFARNNHDGQEYSIHRLRVINFVNIQGSVDSHEMLLEESCTSPSILTYETPIESSIHFTTFPDSLNVHNVEFQVQSDSSLYSENTIAKINDKKKMGRPIKKTRGRKRTKSNAHLDAVIKYKKNHPQVQSDAVKKYKLMNPQAQRDAVDKYKLKNPQAQRDAVEKYNLTQNRRDSRANYKEENPELYVKADARYNNSSRNLEAPLRRSSNLIGAYRDMELNNVTAFHLKNTSLLAPTAYKCSLCSARMFEEEKNRKQWCCGTGSYNVQNFSPLTENFYNNPDFRKRARAFNNRFALSALGVSHGYQHPTSGISFLKIQGRVYHRVFDLNCPNVNNNFGLYINDPVERQNLAANTYLDTNITTEILNFLHNVNPYIECYKRLYLEQSDEAFIMFQRTSRATHGNILGDHPIGQEIAAIISTDTETYVPRSVAVWKVGDSKPHTVDIMDCLYEPLQYILLYPEGNPGWFIGKLDNKGQKLSQLKYVRCLLLSETRFSELSKLSEEWIIDMQCRISEERLRYVQNAQQPSGMLRAAPLNELTDETIQADGIVPGRIYLPATYTGSPRYMKQKYMDAIALVTRKGKPTYFITFTCNPKWREIQESILPGDYPNALICTRVFHLKLIELLKDLRSGLWFGKIDYMIHVIEFQKRGLPHAHICIRVEGGGPVHNIDMDKFVRADIPKESEAGGRLRKAVLSHMIHGPCKDTHLPCWDNDKKKCTKRFPKQETDTTYCDEKGFVHFRRDGKNLGIIKKHNCDVTVSDLWVVPYNASLLVKYDAHINVEISSERTIVKYLFKYMTKGPDEARVTVVPENELNNEIEQYVTKRYMGSSDAAWRILEFEITAREPNVKMLTVHLEDRQTVMFRAGEESERAENSASDLITYFNRPTGAEFDSLTYEDFSEQYIIHPKRPNVKNTTIYETSNGRFVTKRQRGELVSRLFWVPPHKGEQFYLRTLLHVYPCRRYSDLLHLGGPDCTTFQDAAKAVGLADNETEYEAAMLEAATFFTGPRLRNFFVLLAVNGAAVALLWPSFKDVICEDIIRRVGDPNAAYNIALVEIGRRLRKHGSSLHQHGLPSVTDNSTELSRERIEYNVNTLEAFTNLWIPQLSMDQKSIFTYVIQLCTDNDFRDINEAAIFIDGPAGTGKTLLLNVITAYVRGNLKGIVLCTASSAIAAQNYEGGTTAHSMFKLPIEMLDDNGYWSITNGSQRAELIYHANVIIYDEAPMAHKYLIHLLDRSLRDLMRSPRKFGGKIIIFAGDFRQIPPVVPHAKTNSDILNASVKTSLLWKNLKTFSLRTSQRNRDDQVFSDFILKLGSNQLTLHSIPLNGIVQNLCELGIEYVTELDELINFVFGLVIDEPDVCTHRAILCTRNDSVQEINRIILDRVPGDILHFRSYDSIVSDHPVDNTFLNTDSLNRMSPKGIPEHDLKLKIGCICMIIRNLSFTDGLVNGTKVIVVQASQHLIYVRKPGKDEEYLIPRITFKALIDPKSPYEICRRQFPLQVCYAMTIHKSQGQTISRVGVDLRSDIFSHGQLYVALGRVRERRHVKILMHSDRIIHDRAYAKNVIIPGLLQ